MLLLVFRSICYSFWSITKVNYWNISNTNLFKYLTIPLDVCSLLSHTHQVITMTNLMKVAPKYWQEVPNSGSHRYHESLETTKLTLKFMNDLGSVWYMQLNNSFQFLNNITCIYTHFFIHTYLQKIQTMLLEQHYQMGPYNPRINGQ